MSRRLKISLLVLCVVVAVLSAVSIRINPFLFTPGNPGSFEYVRIGERLADKGRYAEALKFFEKAFESSPESDIIKASLAWIYTVYARELDSYGKYDKSLYYFLKAYEVKRDQHTSQNLAMAYSRNALEKLRAGDWSAGIEGYAKAREISSDYRTVSSNLGVYLYNDAYSEFKAGRETIAVLLLSESFLASESKYP
ncbi:MAG TPA: tetratricopeptide repeat protein, partial [Candidatus Omnitrophota bacterium]|nr:tetratricopeptide repeat protein [Candidatus Omnitrophota bacterium]